MSRTFSSWLSGPESAGPSQSDNAPGQGLGLPSRGPGSLAPMGRRTAALVLDWFSAAGLAGLGVPLGLANADEYLIGGAWQTVTMVIWLVLGVVAVRLFGFTPGQYACGLRVIPADSPDAGVGIVRAIGRMLLIALVVPPLFADADGRGLQDRATATAVVRSR